MKAYVKVINYFGLALACLSLLFLFGTVGAIETDTATIKDATGQIITYLAVMFVGALMTNIKETGK